MRLKALVWVSSFAVICFFLPSLVMKLWEWLRSDLWFYRGWLIYPLVAFLLIFIARRRRRAQLARSGMGEGQLLLLVKERLARGEITIDEFHLLRQELFSKAVLNQLEE